MRLFKASQMQNNTMHRKESVRSFGVFICRPVIIGYLRVAKTGSGTTVARASGLRWYRYEKVAARLRTLLGEFQVLLGIPLERHSLYCRDP